MSEFALHLLRHGEVEGAGRLFGHCDSPPRGSGVAACLDRSRALHFGQLISSDLSRATVPARRIAKEAGLPCSTDPRWRELNFGQWDGQSPTDIDPAALRGFWADPQANAPPGGESWSALKGRVEGALAAIDRTTLVVAHAGSIRAALSCLLGLDHRQCWAVALPYAALISLVIRDEGGGRSAQMTGLYT